MTFVLSSGFSASGGSEVRFSGIRQPRLGAPNIEVETEGGQIVDLYNESNLRSVVRHGDELAFEFDAAEGYGTFNAVLRFLGVRDLRVVQPEDWHPEEANQIEDYLIREKGPWRRVTFKAGGLEYEFNAAELRVTVEPAPN